MNVPTSRVVVVGDDVRDIVAAKSAGAISVGVLWGAHNKGELVNSKPGKVFDRVSDLRVFLLNYYK